VHRSNDRAASEVKENENACAQMHSCNKPVHNKQLKFGTPFYAETIIVKLFSEIRKKLLGDNFILQGLPGVAMMIIPNFNMLSIL
jgi:hypothetical protein